MKVAFFYSDHARSQRIRNLMVAGWRGLINPKHIEVIDERDYREVCSHVAVFYGLKGNLKRILGDYAVAGRKAVFIDLGYFRRHDEYNPEQGYHRISINDYHPWRQIKASSFSSNRFDKLGIKTKPMRSNGNHILVAGMSAKAAGVYGYRAEEWERGAIEQLKRHTHRQIIYRPKPSWEGARPIRGVAYSKPQDPLSPVLDKAWAVVTHHSNVSIDGQLKGVPSFCDDGAARCVSLQSLDDIEEPLRLSQEERDQFLFNLAYFQWHTFEMRDGTLWRFLLDNGMI